ARGSGSGRSKGPLHTAWAIAVAALLTLGGAGAIAWETPRSVGPTCSLAEPGPAARSPIQHLFVLIKENHAFENYFGDLAGVEGSPPNGSFPVVLGSNATVSPFPLVGDSTPDLPHDHGSEIVDEDNGRNDQFVAEAAAEGYPDPAVAVGYYTGSQIPQYYAYAHAYALGDEFFSGYLGPTDPNRDFDLAGSTVDQTNNTQPPEGGLAAPTILDQMTSAGISWAYDYLGTETGITPLEFSGVARNYCESARVLPFSSFPGQLASPNPPAVTFIDPSHDDGGNFSEHPPDNVSLGAEWTAAVVNAILSSSIGPSSAILLFYDEAGGFWDPITPPVIDGSPDGFRVPFQVISDYTPGGLIVHQVMDPGSVLHFIDTNWNLPALNARVGEGAALSPFFDFAAPPRPPLILATPINLSTNGSGRSTEGGNDNALVRTPVEPLYVDAVWRDGVQVGSWVAGAPSAMVRVGEASRWAQTGPGEASASRRTRAGALSTGRPACRCERTRRHRA
ncbi:MAG: hypothetical protein L3K17_08230, partial [Thermoplasmata archaeon]|nr:hypothetical protein [Thermoplasmata archaeon]